MSCNNFIKLKSEFYGSRHGLTLVELLVALVLAVFILSLLAGTFRSAIRLYRTTQSEEIPLWAQTLQQDLLQLMPVNPLVITMRGHDTSLELQTANTAGLQARSVVKVRYALENQNGQQILTRSAHAEDKDTHHILASDVVSFRCTIEKVSSNTKEETAPQLQNTQEALGYDTPHVIRIELKQKTTDHTFSFWVPAYVKEELP